jgi:uncharacterized protein (DUF2141 family)
MMIFSGIRRIRPFSFGNLIFVFIFYSCANIVAPTGGVKDIVPPKVIRTEPDNISTYFKGNTIRLYFDEYIQLKDESRVIVISPPADKAPEAKIKGKSVILTLPGTLRENTTYSVFFGTAIQDYNEGNPLTDFSYVFSTGDWVDSLSAEGNVIKADNLEGAAKVMVGIYSSTDDSVVFKEKPEYITRTDDKGHFRFSHIAAGAYKIIAIKDDNTDMTASLPAEEIAFLDSLVYPSYLSPADTAKRDSSKIRQHKLIGLTMMIFKQKDSTLRIHKAYLEKPYQLIIPFSIPVENVEVIPLGTSAGLSKDWFSPEWSRNRDTLIYWVSPFITQDSLNLCINAEKKVTDTVHLDLKRFGKGGKYRKDKDKAGKLTALPSVTSTLIPGEDFRLTFSYPILESRWDECRLIRLKDTIKLRPVFTDSLHRHCSVRYPWEENTSFQFLIPKGALKDWTGQLNDSLVYKFSTKSIQDYGNLAFTFQSTEPGNYILQLLDDKSNVIRETVMLSTGVWKINYVSPGKYRIKMIQDKNNNSRWDSGNYRFKIQPERISFYPKTLEIRGNWDLEESWKW